MDKSTSLPVVDVKAADVVRKNEARAILRHHTAMPYCLGGSCTKYQGFNNTYCFLKRDHDWIFDTLGEKEVFEIIYQTIAEEKR